MPSAYRFDRARAPWWVLGALVAAVLLFILYSFIGTFVFGLFLYYATRPVYQRLVKRLGSRTLAAAISLVTLAIPFLLLLAYTTAVALGQLAAFVADDGFGEFQSALEPYLDLSEIVSDPEQLLADPSQFGFLSRLLEDAPTYIGLVGAGALHAFIVLALAYYLLKDDHILAAWVTDTFGDNNGILETYLREIDRDFQTVFFGNILNAFITAIVGALVFSALNVIAPPAVSIPVAALLGVLCGAASLIPVVGMKLVYVPVGGYLLVRAAMTAPTELLWFPVLFIGVAFVFVDFIPDMILRPYVSGRDLHLGSVMIAYIVGPLLFGWYGIFLGPMLLIVIVHFVRHVLPVLFADRPAEPPVAANPAMARLESTQSADTGDSTKTDNSSETTSEPKSQTDSDTTDPTHPSQDSK